jgi:MiaB-like tRNA modifying enzyme
MKIKFITFGCSNNISESEIMCGLLKKANHEIVENNEDIRIVNICSVKSPSLNKGIKEIKNSPVPIIIAGCIPKESIEILKSIRPDVSLMNTHNFDKIVEVVEKTSQGLYLEVLDKSKKVKICLPKIRKNPIVNIVPIASGCKGECTYCSVRNIKGKLYSFPPELIITEIKQSLKEGCKEIWLTAQDTGAYGLDIGTTLPKLLNQILEIKGDFKIRLGMTNPQFMIRYLDEIIEIFNNPKMFKFLHIPVQSGSNRTLFMMKRPYTSKQYKQIISKLKKSHPKITISTDIIIGFPTETDEDFEETINLIKETKPNVLNFSKFWLRPGTEAEQLKKLPGKTIKERSMKIKEVFEKYALENNKKWEGWEGEIIIDEFGKLNSSVGRNFAYKPIILKGKHKLGEELKIKIKKVTFHDFRT